MVQFAEAATEGNQIFIGQSLLTKQQDLMVEPGSVNGFELIGLNLCDIYAANLGAERLFSWDDLHTPILSATKRHKNHKTVFQSNFYLLCFCAFLWPVPVHT